jgi:hypothetical protein
MEMVNPEPEFQRQEYHRRGISLARLIASEFATPESLVNPILRESGTSIEINGNIWEGDREFIPEADLRGNEIAVLGKTRQWKFKYPESQ